MKIIGQKNVAICYSTKDRVEFTQKTLPPILAESDKFDLFIIDGSSTETGRNHALELNTRQDIHGVHVNITGGADVAIVYALSFMLERGYEYVGLIENDVLLEPGWFDRIMALFHQGVGSVSARCYKDRILSQHQGYARMANIGAGMVVFSAKAAEIVLSKYRTGSLMEYLYWPQYYENMKAPIPHEVEDTKKQYMMTADWFYESSLMEKGLVALACTPSMASSVDPGTHELLQTIEGNAPVKAEVWHSPPSAMLGNHDVQIGFVAQPHQIFLANVDAFQGEWKLKWAKHNGPFGMVSVKDAVLQFNILGSAMQVLMDIKEGAEVTAFINGAEAGVIEKSSGYCNFQFSEFASHHIRLKFKGEVMVMTCVFHCPQPWFQDGYHLRYEHLRKYL